MVFQIRGQELRIEGSVVAEGALNFVTFELRCDKSWRKFNKTVRFYHVGSEEHCDLPDTKEGECYYFPEELLKEGEVEVSVVGVMGGDTVATTTKGKIFIKGSLKRGATPKVSRDAYAKYVNDVLRHRKACERYHGEILKLAKETEGAREESESFSKETRQALSESRRIFENVSGAMDAIGIALREIREHTEALLNFEGDLKKSEEHRQLLEKARAISEGRRERRSLEVIQGEREREASESTRITAERLRAVSENERAKRVSDLEKRIDALEDKGASSLGSYLEGVTFSESVTFDEKTPVESISLFGSSEPCDGKILSLGDSGSIKITLNSESILIRAKAPLMSVGGLYDELVIQKSGAHVVRRLASVTFSGCEDIIEEEAGEERMLYAIELSDDAYRGVCDDTLGISSRLSYGRGDGDSVWVSEDFAFFNLSREEFPSKSALSEWLSALKEAGVPLTIIYPLLKEKSEEVMAFDFDGLVTAFSSEGSKIKMNIKKNLSTTLSEIIHRIDGIEKAIGNGEK